jgi:hypothetical protein
MRYVGAGGSAVEHHTGSDMRLSGSAVCAGCIVRQLTGGGELLA